jgi:hypothetical protein
MLRVNYHLSVHCELTINCLTVHCELTITCLSVHCELTITCLSVHCELTINCLSVGCELTINCFVCCELTIIYLTVHCVYYQLLNTKQLWTYFLLNMLRYLTENQILTEAKPRSTSDFLFKNTACLLLHFENIFLL